jgi:hypothetical protein
MGRKALDLSTSQLIAGGLATLAAAVGASFLGVYGTVVGAAFMSVVSTAGAAVAKHYLDQGKEQIKERTHLHDAARGETVARAAAARATSADPSVTRFDRSPAETVADAVAAEAGEAGRVAVRKAAGRDAFRDTLSWAKRRWVVLALSSVAVFAAVMGGITVLEKVTDRPASAWVGARDGQGTTLSNLGGDGGGAPAETPATDDGEPAPRPSDAPTTGPGTTTEPTSEPTQPPTSGPETGPTTPPTSEQPPAGPQPTESSDPGGEDGSGSGSGPDSQTREGDGS